MKKTKVLNNRLPIGNKLSRVLSATMLATFIMSGNTLSAADLTVDGSAIDPADRVFTVTSGSPHTADTVSLIVLH